MESTESPLANEDSSNETCPETSCTEKTLRKDEDAGSSSAVCDSHTSANDSRPSSTMSTEFVSSIVERLCENCMKIRENIIALSDSSDCSSEEGSDQEDPEDICKAKIIPEGEGPGQGKGLLRNLHRRTISEIDWQQISLFVQELSPVESDGSSVKSTKEKIKNVLKEGKEELQVAFKAMENINLDTMTDQAEKCIMCMLNTGWKVVSHWELPDWLRDNDFLSHGHRPPLPSFKKCFESMFRVHTETGNIWTHLIGLILVVIAMLYVYIAPAASSSTFPTGWQEYLVFGAFFMGAITCLLFSWLFHTVYCHSSKVHNIFSKLDYSGIACLIVGSSVPCFYYGFYCRTSLRLTYLVLMTVFGVIAIVVSLWEKFATPKFRPLRAGVFLCLGCSGFIPSIHMLIVHGFRRGVEQGALGWLLLMGILYIIGAVLYAFRVPERFFPGKCDIMFQSHQIFHVLVVVAAFVHLHGICKMATYRLNLGRTCPSS